MFLFFFFCNSIVGLYYNRSLAQRRVISVYTMLCFKEVCLLKCKIPHFLTLKTSSPVNNLYAHLKETSSKPVRLPVSVFSLPLLLAHSFLPLLPAFSFPALHSLPHPSLPSSLHLPSFPFPLHPLPPPFSCHCTVSV